MTSFWLILTLFVSIIAVSYTHLDVYKRQALAFSMSVRFILSLSLIHIQMCIRDRSIYNRIITVAHHYRKIIYYKFLSHLYRHGIAKEKLLSPISNGLHTVAYLEAATNFCISFLFNVFYFPTLDKTQIFAFYLYIFEIFFIL